MLFEPTADIADVLSKRVFVYDSAVTGVVKERGRDPGLCDEPTSDVDTTNFGAAIVKGRRLSLGMEQYARVEDLITIALKQVAVDLAPLVEVEGRAVVVEADGALAESAWECQDSTRTDRHGKSRKRREPHHAAVAARFWL